MSNDPVKDPVEPPKDDKPPEITWDNIKSSLIPELRDSPHLKNINDVSLLASGYIEAQKALSTKTSRISKDESWETFATKTTHFFNLPKEQKDYDSKFEGDDKKIVDELGFKYKLTPTQAREFAKNYKAHSEKSIETQTNEKVESWRNDSSIYLKTVENKDEVIGRALGKIGMTREDFEKELGNVVHNPVINKIMVSLGKQEKSLGVKDPALSTGGIGLSDKTSLQEKKDFINSHINNSAGPFYDRSHPEYGEIQKKIDAYSKEVTKAQQKGLI